MSAYNIQIGLFKSIFTNLFLRTYLILQFCTRVSLVLYSWHYDNIEKSEIHKIFLVGFLNDFLSLVYLFPIVLFFQSMFGRKVRSCSGFVPMSAIAFFMLLVFLIMNSIGEVIFWDKYGVRYNFIAVDYFLYSNKLPTILFERLPIVKIFLTIISVSLLVTIFMFKKLKEACSSINNFHNLTLILIFSCLSFYSFFYLDTKFMNQFFEHKQSVALSKNGFYEISSSFRDGTFDYAEFYPALPKSEAEEIVRHAKIDNIKHDLVHHNIPRNYNVVLIVAENFGSEFLAKFGNKSDITPNLNELSTKSLFFSDIYASGTRTTRAIEAITLASIPVPGSSVIHQENSSSILNIASVLKKHNYQNIFSYGGYSYFSNLSKYFVENEYQILDRAKFRSDEVSFANFWGIADEDVFTKTLEYLDDYHSRSKPFFSMILTTSSHYPYSIPEGKIDISDLDELSASIKYTDYAIGKFLRDAEKKTWFDNTIFIITSDHGSLHSKSSELDIEEYHIPLIIYAPKMILPGENDHFGSQIDITPTILTLLEIDYEDTKSFGVDLIKEDPKRAFISTYQLLGYLKETDANKKTLVILSPQNKAKTFEVLDGSDHKKYTKLISKPGNDADSKGLVKEAVSFFQSGCDILK